MLTVYQNMVVDPGKEMSWAGLHLHPGLQKRYLPFRVWAWSKQTLSLKGWKFGPQCSSSLRGQAGLVRNTVVGGD